MTLGLAAFIGFVAMGVWLGDMLLRRGRAPGEGRPIGSALLGLFLLLVLSIIPLVSFFVGWFALGTVTLSFWRALVGRDDRYPPPAGMQADPAWPSQQPGWGTPAPQVYGQQPPAGQPAGWGQQPPAGPPPGWGQQPPAGPPAGWGQQPPAGPPAGWGQPPTQDR